MKKTLCLSLVLVSSSLFSMQSSMVTYDHKQSKPDFDRISFADNPGKMYIDPYSVHIPKRLGSLDLYHSKKGFYVRQDDGKKQPIKKYFTDPMLRDITKPQLRAFLANGYLSLNQMNDGELSLKAKGRLNGSGPIGVAVGCFLGKAAVSIVGHGAIQIVALCTGPAYFPVMIALESTLGVGIEKASLAGAIAGGIALGTATGPV